MARRKLRKEKKQLEDAQKYPLHYAASDGDLEKLLSLVTGLNTSTYKDKHDDDEKKINESDIGIDAQITVSNSKSLKTNSLVNIRDTKGRTPLHWASRNGHTRVCKALFKDLKANANISSEEEKEEKDDYGVTPLELAVWKLNYETSLYLIKEAQANVFRLNGYGCGILHWCGLSGHVYFKTLSSITLSEFRLAENKDSKNINPNIEVLDQQEQNMLRMIELLLESFSSRQSSKSSSHKLLLTPNDHGQTPFHKAAYSGNIPLLTFVIHTSFVNNSNSDVDADGMIDQLQDKDGNIAADCAERSQKKELAIWIRRFTSPLLYDALNTMGLKMTSIYDEHDNNEVNSSIDYILRKMEKKYNLPRPPSLSIIRQKYLELARLYHPDKQQIQHHHHQQQKEMLKWFKLRFCYTLLHDWHINPSKYDNFVRQQTRNRNIIIDTPILLTDGRINTISRFNGSHHDVQPIYQNEMTIDKDSQHPTQSQPANQDDELSLFCLRLNKILSSESYRESGLQISKLPKLYSKWYPPSSFPSNNNNNSNNDDHEHDYNVKRRMRPTRNTNGMPNPKNYKGCSNGKLVTFLQKYCQRVCRVERQKTGEKRGEILLFSCITQ